MLQTILWVAFAVWLARCAVSIVRWRQRQKLDARVARALAPTAGVDRGGLTPATTSHVYRPAVPGIEYDHEGVAINNPPPPARAPVSLKASLGYFGGLVAVTMLVVLAIGKISGW